MQKYLFSVLASFSCTCFKRVLFLSDLDSHRCNTCQFDPFQPQPIRNIKHFCNPTYKNEKLGCVSNLKVLVQCQGESQNRRFPTFSVHFVMVQLKRGTLSNAQGLFSSLWVTQSLINSSSGGFFCLFVSFYFYGNYNTPLLLLFWRSHISRNHFLMRIFSKSVECPGLHCGRTVKSCLFNCYGYIWL